MADDIDHELACEEETEKEIQSLTTGESPHGSDRVFVADEPSNTASSDTADAHSEKRRRTEHGFISQPTHAGAPNVDEDRQEDVGVALARLKHAFGNGVGDADEALSSDRSWRWRQRKRQRL